MRPRVTVNSPAFGAADQLADDVLAVARLLLQLDLVDLGLEPADLVDLGDLDPVERDR